MCVLFGWSHSADAILFCWILLLPSIRSRAAARLSDSEVAEVLMLLTLELPESSFNLGAADSDDSTGFGLLAAFGPIMI